nr:putative major capsid protein [uncultured Mediterranean phage uvMED]
MSINVTTAFVQQYSANIQLLSQQMGSLLRDKVRLESVVGKNAFFDQVGAVTAQKRTSRHGDTPQIDTPHARRRVSLVDYEFADLIDDQDKVRLLIDPTSSYAQAAAYAMGRAMDDEIISAAIGTAFTGETGSTSTANANQIVHGSAGLTIAKLRTAKQTLDLASVDPSIPRFIIVGPKQITDLLGTTEVTSSDFNTVKALANGEINSFLGFNFIVSNRLSLSGTTRSCIAYAQDGIALAVGKDVTARIDERADKGYATQVYYCASFGATRMEEDKVVEVQCTES